MLQIKSALTWLTAISPELPWALLALGCFVAIYICRKFAPKLWLRFEVLSPFVVADPAPVLAALHKAFQAMPSVLIGLVLPAVISGGDWRMALTGGLVGLLPPILHELAKWAPWLPYRGELSKPKSDRKDPPDDPDTTVSIMPEPVKLVAQDRSRLHNDRPDEPAEFRGFRYPALSIFGVALLLACVVSCAAAEKRLPCDESKLRAIDAEYSAKVIAVCLPRYDSKEACPEWPTLQVEHRRQLKEACP